MTSFPDEWGNGPDQFEVMRDLKVWAHENIDRANGYQALLDAANEARHKADHAVTRRMLELRVEYRDRDGKVPAVDLLERQAVDDCRVLVVAADGAEAAVKASEKVLRAVESGLTAYQSILRSIREHG